MLTFIKVQLELPLTAPIPQPLPRGKGINDLVLLHPYQLYKQFSFIKKKTLGILTVREGVRSFRYTHRASEGDPKGRECEVRCRTNGVSKKLGGRVAEVLIRLSLSRPIFPLGAGYIRSGMSSL